MRGEGRGAMGAGVEHKDQEITREKERWEGLSA